MDTTTPMNWSARTPRRAYGFKTLLGVCAMAAALFSAWPLIHGNVIVIALGLVAVILILACVRFVMPVPRDSAIKNDKARSLTRVAPGHWRVAGPGCVSDGALRHVWYGWGWMTLQIQPYGQQRSLTLTVWRVNVSGAAWHHLRVWTAWELAMVTPPTLEIRH